MEKGSFGKKRWVVYRPKFGVAHGSALVVGSSYRWCAAGSGGWALAPITGTAGAGLGCPGVRPFRVEDDDASMTSAAVWVRRVLLRVRMVGAY